MENALKAVQREIDRLNHEMDKVVKLFLQTFFNYREVRVSEYEYQTRLNIHDGDIILKWNTHMEKRSNGETVIKKYGPYWCWCIYQKFDKPRADGKKGRFGYPCIGTTINKDALIKFLDKKKEKEGRLGSDKLNREEKAYYLKHMTNMPRYEIFDKQLANYRKERNALTKVKLSLMGKIREANKKKVAAK